MLIRRGTGSRILTIGDLGAVRYCGKGQGAAAVVTTGNLADCYTVQNSAPTVTGASTRTQFRNIGGAFQLTLMRPDLSVVPVGKTITAATLTLYAQSVVAGVDTAALYRILGANAGWLELCNWNYADGAGASDRWAGDAGGDGGADAGCSVSGTDYAAVAMGTFTMGNNDPVGTAYVIALDAAEMNLMLAANYGVVIRGTAGTDTKTLCSREHGTAGYRPLWTITYV